jgi:ATP-binding cassette, subfamily C, bacterial CydC
VRSPDPLLSALALLRPRTGRVALAIVLGALSLGSAVALIAMSAWLITRAWEMPPVLQLTVAVVTVRALAISRGVFGYCERLASHDTALRASGTGRERIYERLACGPVDRVVRRRSGELVTGVGADVDHVADALVRGFIPFGVAAMLACAGTAVIAVISPAAAVAMAACMLVAGLIAPWLAARAARGEEAAALRHQAARDAAALAALEHADELRVSGRLDAVIAECHRQQSDWGSAADRAVKPSAIATALPTAATGVSLLAAVVWGIALTGTVAPTTVAVLMLVPLAAFEAFTALPAAATALTRARIAARRLNDLAGPAVQPQRGLSVATPGAGELAALGLRCGHSPHTGGDPITVTLAPGARAVVTGPSGAGKTVLLMTLAGLLPPVHGVVTLDGQPLQSISEADLVRRVGFFAEDAHVFATTVRDNLLVARGDCGDDEIVDALDRVGLHRWRSGLPDGLATVLIGGAQAVSAGQRRRLLLARALLSPAEIVLLDEPTEHLDIDDAEPMLAALLDPAGGLFGRDRTVVVATHQRPAQGSGVSVHVEVTPEIGPLVLSGNGFQRQRASG